MVAAHAYVPAATTGRAAAPPTAMVLAVASLLLACAPAAVAKADRAWVKRRPRLSEDAVKQKLEKTMCIVQTSVYVCCMKRMALLHSFCSA